MRFVERLWSDVCLGVRTALKSPVITIVVVATLALGIAATSVSFSVMNALFIRPLPIHEAHRFVRLYQHRAGQAQHLPIFLSRTEDVRELSHVFDGVVAEQPTPLSLGVAGMYERVWGENCFGGVFSSCSA
jgi:putative ABC transport system permease protein